jgi:hypothetical protein
MTSTIRLRLALVGMLGLVGTAPIHSQAIDRLPASIPICKHISENVTQDVRGFALTMTREACRGSCPIYSIALSSDGTVEYEGIEFVNVKGKRRYLIPIDQVNKLISEVRAVQFFSLKDSYRTILKDGVETSVTDRPATTITVTLDGKTKTVVDYYGTPESVKSLEDRIDELTGVKRFITAR